MQISVWLCDHVRKYFCRRQENRWRNLDMVIGAWLSWQEDLPASCLLPQVKTLVINTIEQPVIGCQAWLSSWSVIDMSCPKEDLHVNLPCHVLCHHQKYFVILFSHMQGHEVRRDTLKLIFLIYGRTKPNIEVSGWLYFVSLWKEIKKNKVQLPVLTLDLSVHLSKL